MGVFNNGGVSRDINLSLHYGEISKKFDYGDNMIHSNFCDVKLAAS